MSVYLSFASSELMEIETILNYNTIKLQLTQTLNSDNAKPNKIKHQRCSLVVSRQANTQSTPFAMMYPPLDSLISALGCTNAAVLAFTLYFASVFSLSLKFWLITPLMPALQ
jgi:hypothetical protein